MGHPKVTERCVPGPVPQIRTRQVKSDSSGTTTTEDTTTTETTVATATTATTAASKDETAQKETTKKTLADIPDKGVHGSATKPKGVSRRARSTKTTSSSARRRKLEATEELARMELKQAQAAAKLARIRLELAQCEDEDSMDEDQEDRTAQVQNWIETSVMEENNMGKHEQRGQHPPEEPIVKPEENSSTKKDTSEIQALTSIEGSPYHTRRTSGHFLVDCQKFQKTSIQDRWATVKKSHVCFKCLQGKHRKESCKKPPCKECKRWHHHLLHVEPENRTSGEKKAETQEEVASVMTSRLCEPQRGYCSSYNSTEKGRRSTSQKDPTWKMTKRKGTKTVEKQHRSSKTIEKKYIPMNTELLEKAETLLLKRSQDNSFREDIKRLQQGKQLEGSSKLKRLDVVLEEGLLGLKGRDTGCDQGLQTTHRARQ
ncbi:unnamed protein product [Parnassius apollo]|uniref:(apollo) hypothetical protein n=1 Tax=Parnassius apollo TaxID=110799 RepID=A0A8S3W1Y8_PARAO|nr:unnamed protein product [Parnassius apollo]